MTLTATLSVGIQAELAGAPDEGSAVHTIAKKLTQAFSNGTGANQANNVFADDFAISGAGTQTYDLAGGVTNALGQTLTFTAIKALIVQNTGSAVLNIGGGSNPFLGWLGDASDVIKVPVGGFVVLCDPTAAGQAVTASTGDIVTIGATDGAGTIIVIGEA